VPGLRISELARTSGFSVTTLRYYETVGLLEPARDRNGYRSYEPADVERLRFVSAAKALGLRLDEIVELVARRDGGACAPVRERIAELVAEKLSDTRNSIEQLTMLASELARIAARMGATAVPASCGEGCGCPDHLVELEPRPAACSLTGPELAIRRADWQVAVASARRREPTSYGWRLWFPAEPERAAGVAALAAAELRCCSSLSFTVSFAGDDFVLDVGVPPDARPVLADVFGA
jgi:DNA-binding transcriptional MerR regulator